MIKGTTEQRKNNRAQNYNWSWNLMDQGQSHNGYQPYLRQIMSSHTAPDSALEAELKHLCLENRYKALWHRWQLRPEHVTTS